MEPKDMPRTLNYCRICGSTPRTVYHAQNIGPIKYWEPDDGWVIGSLCPDCYDDYGHARPKPDDYAYTMRDGYPDIQTDDDPTLAF